MTVIRHALAVAMDDEANVFEDSAIAFSENGIEFIGNDDDLPAEYKTLDAIDGRGHLLVPGMCNMHTHLGMISFRSLADDVPDRLHRFLMPLENNAMTESLAVASAKIAIAEMIRGGITSAVDMYYHEAAIAKTASHMGFRLWAGETVLDAPHPGAASFDESLARCDELCSMNDPLVTPLIAPHAPYSLSERNLEKSFSYAESHGIMWTMHLQELPMEMSLFKERHSMSPIAWMDDEGLLSSNLIAAHLLLASDDDIMRLAENDVRIVNCPGSNAKAAKGVARIPEMAEAGCIATLGTDGPSSGNTLDMFMQMRLYAILNKNRLSDRAALPASDVVPLAFRNAGLALSSEIGQLRKGYRSDIVMLSLEDVNTIPCFDPYSVLVYSASPMNVTDVFIEGRQLLKNREFTFPFDEIAEEFREASAGFRDEALKLL